MHPSCAYLKLKEKEEEPYEAVAIAVKAKTVEDVKLGDKPTNFTLHSFADEIVESSRVSCRGSDARMKCEALQPNAVAGYCVWSKAGFCL